MDVVETISLWLEQYSGLIAIISGVGLLTLLSSVMNKPKANAPSVSSSRMADVKASIKKQEPVVEHPVETPADITDQAETAVADEVQESATKEAELSGKKTISTA